MTEPAVVQPQNLDPHSPSAAAQALQSLQDRPSEPTPPEAIKPSSKTLVELEGVTYKRCTHCKELKVRDQNFNKDKSRGDGFACTCKGCANRHTRAWHERHKQQVSMTSTSNSKAHFCFHQHTAAHNTCYTTRNLIDCHSIVCCCAELREHCSWWRQLASTGTVQPLQGIQATLCLLWRHKPSKRPAAPLQVGVLTCSCRSTSISDTYPSCASGYTAILENLLHSVQI